MITILKAFEIQLVLFLFGALAQGIKCWALPPRKLNFIGGKKEWAILILLWFGLGTCMRVYLQLPANGLLSNLM